MRLSLWLILCLFAQTSVSQPLRVEDALGRLVVLPKTAARIVSLSPATTEILFAIGAGHHLVATSSGTYYPEEAKLLPQVATPGQINIEAILALKPDLVLFWSDGFSVAKAAKLEQFDVPWFATAPRGLEDLAALMEVLGRLTGHQEAGQAQAEHFLSEVTKIKASHQGKSAVSYFYQVSARPLLTLNGEHLVSEAIGLCGGENIFADLPVLVPRIGLEAVLAANPEVIFISEGIYQQAYENWKKWPFLRAVNKKQLFMLEDDRLQRPTLRLLEGIKATCLALNKARSIDKQG